MKKKLSSLNNKIILHTSPHPDDVTLGYLPFINWLLKKTNNKNYFLTVTSGSNAVRNCDLERVLNQIEDSILNITQKDLLTDYVFNNILKLLSITSMNKKLLLNKIYYLRKNLDKKINSFEIKKIKGFIREFEEESVWTSLGILKKNIFHFRANFYSYPDEGLEKDINDFYKLLLNINPDILTLAMDPKGIGPLTHYKSFLLIKFAVKKFYETTGKDIDILGYRNVWHQFEPKEANIYFPVKNVDFELLKTTFLNFYKTQIDAMFPSSKYDGDFSDIVIKIMQENKLKLADNLFIDLKEDVNGFCFLKIMKIKEFLKLLL